MIQLTVKNFSKLTCGLALGLLCQPSLGASKSEFSLKPSLGYTYFNIQGASTEVSGDADGSLEYNYKGGNSAGVIAEYSISEAFELEAGLEYVETGAKLAANFGILSLNFGELKVNSLFVPLRAKYNFNPSSTGTRFSARAGLAPTFLLAAKSEYLGESTNVKSSFNSFGLMSQVGLGFDWDIVGGRLAADLNYNYGLTKTFKEGSGKTVGYQMSVGYIFSL